MPSDGHTPPQPNRIVIEYEASNGKSPFQRWFNRLEGNAAAKVARIVARLESGGRPDSVMVRPGVFEARIHSGPGYRIYYALDGARIIILLGGGDKSTQDKDIDNAETWWIDYKKRRDQI